MTPGIPELWKSMDQEHQRLAISSVSDVMKTHILQHKHVIFFTHYLPSFPLQFNLSKLAPRITDCKNNHKIMITSKVVIVLMLVVVRMIMTVIVILTITKKKDPAYSNKV